MKFTLKLLKDQNKAILEEEPDSSIDPRFAEWLEGFEKELQEEIKGYQRVTPSRLMEGKDCQKVVIDKLKEILGE